MANNKIQLRDGTTLLDVSADTVTSATLSAGVTAHDASGVQITGVGGMFSFDANGKFLYPAVVTVPNTITALQGTERSFRGHTEPMKITFENGSALSQTPAYAFYGCTGLTEIEFPASITTFNGYLLSGCSALKKVVFNSDANIVNIANTNQGNPFYGCVALEDIKIPTDWVCGNATTIMVSNGTANFTNVMTHDSMVAMIANLKDLTGETAKTLSLGATNLARLSEAEKSVAAAKNWTLA